MVFETETRNGRQFGNYNNVKVFVDGIEKPNVARVKVNNDSVWIDVNIFEANFVTQSSGPVGFYSSHGVNIIENTSQISTYFPAGNNIFTASAGRLYVIKSSYFVTHFKFTSGSYRNINIENSWSLTTAESMFENCTSLVQCNWKGAIRATDFTNTWKGCSALFNLEISDTSDVVTFDSTWEGCTSLTSFLAIELDSANILNRTWAECTNITVFGNMDYSPITEFISTWEACRALTSFQNISIPNTSKLISTWKNCDHFNSFPAINTQTVLEMRETWSGCKNMSVFPLLDTSNVTDLSGAWFECTGIGVFPTINTQNVVNLKNTWTKCEAMGSFPLINTSKVTNFEETWAFTFLGTIPALDFSKGINFKSTFAGGLFTNLPILNTTLGQSFQNMFKDSTSLQCIKGVDTRNQTSTSNMFQGCTSLSHPNATDKPLILAGALWTNSWECPALPPQGITDLSATDDQVDQITFTWTPAVGSPPPTYDLYQNLTLIASNVQPGYIWNTDGAQVDLHLKSHNNGGDGVSNHVIGNTKLLIDLVQYNSTINLNSVIAPHFNGHRIVEITNSKTQPSIVSGDVSTLDVTFTNTGEIQGTSASSDAITLTSDVKIINNGWIRGAGGSGGNGGNGGRGGTGGIGGRGRNDTYLKNTIQYQGGCSGNLSAWFDHDGSNTINLWWNGTRKDYNTTSTGPLTIPGYTGVFYRDVYVERTYCNVWSNTYKVKRVETLPRYGGTGGIGGVGGNGGVRGIGGNAQSFSSSKTFGTSGQPGTGGAVGHFGNPSSPPGGFTGAQGGTGGTGGPGGTGGAGGVWGTIGGAGGNGGTGQTGNPGHTGSGSSGTAGYSGQSGSFGTAGTNAGAAINGSAFLSPGSIAGSVSGNIV